MYKIRKYLIIKLRRSKVKILVALDSNIPCGKNRALYQRCITFLASGQAKLVVRKNVSLPDELTSHPNTYFAKLSGRLGLFIECLRLLKTGEFQAIYVWHFPFFIFLPFLLILYSKTIVSCMESQHSPYYYIDSAKFKNLFVKIAARLIFLMAKLIYPKIDLHIVMAHNNHHGLAKRLSEQFNVSIDKILAMSNGVDIKLIQQIVSQFTDYQQNKEFIICYVGTIRPGKGYELIEITDDILDKIPCAKIVVAGPLRGISADNLRRPGVEYHGIVSHTEAIRLMYNSDVCVFIGDSKIRDNEVSHPGKILEYMALGKPVIANNYPGIKEFFAVEDQFLLYEENDTKKIIELLSQLQSDVNLRIKISKNMRDSVVHFDWNTINFNFMKKLNKCLCETYETKIDSR